MARQAQLEQRLQTVHKTASAIVTVLGNVQARVPGKFPENLDDLHTAIKRGELRRVLKCAEDLVAEVDKPFPTEELSPERQAKRDARRTANTDARAKKKAAKKTTTKKTAKKKTGGG